MSQLLKQWALRDWEDDGEDLLDHSAIQYLSRIAFHGYEPAPFEPFDQRLDHWIHNVDDDTDRQTLFRLLNYFFYIGRPEFDSLYRAAFNGNIVRWLIDQLDIDLGDAKALETLNEGVASTWFCPFTDSMRINSFLKANELTGHGHRPDWRSLRKFGDKKKILNYIENNGIHRIVLLEDFVGSGSQIHSAIEFAATLSSDIPLLAVPLVVCPVGDEVGQKLSEDNENVTYDAVLRISPDNLITFTPSTNEPPLFAAVRELISQVRDRLNCPAPDSESQLYHGYRNTGAIIAMYSNCPDNSLPIIYDETEEWQPLFPRIRRG